MNDSNGSASSSTPRPVIITDLVWNRFNQLALIRNAAVPGAGCFSQIKNCSTNIEAVRTLTPGPLLVSEAAADTNILAYVAAPVRVEMLSEIEQMQTPALAILTPADITALTADKPGLRVIAHATVDGQFRVVELHPD